MVVLVSRLPRSGVSPVQVDVFTSHKRQRTTTERPGKGQNERKGKVEDGTWSERVSGVSSLPCLTVARSYQLLEVCSEYHETEFDTFARVSVHVITSQ